MIRTLSRVEQAGLYVARGILAHLALLRLSLPLLLPEQAAFGLAGVSATQAEWPNGACIIPDFPNAGPRPPLCSESLAARAAERSVGLQVRDCRRLQGWCSKQSMMRCSTLNPHGDTGIGGVRPSCPLVSVTESVFCVCRARRKCAAATKAGGGAVVGGHGAAARRHHSTDSPGPDTKPPGPGLNICFALLWRMECVSQ